MKVPLFKQKDKLDCGPTALRMVLEYYGKKIRADEIIKGIGGIKNFGVRTIKLADFARKLGFKTLCLSYNEKLSKGKAKIKTPSKSDIINVLDKNRPAILSVNTSILFGNKSPKDMGHFIVVTIYKNGYFWYNDPRDGKEHKIEEEKLLFAWFNNVLDSSAYLLAIWR
ncbi:hypothetical protein A2715_04255 [Candidatus Woesebacteria bacterium RIFCSPHIGHO2_01_FULL_39_32]|uniref:Peptidase C39 domain-containing protein n=1 Tax=Candidatus Woesebacteria bacterium RIFCSPLOWO2_01_FULL_39_25 TaxID=1802521 RepID=A0A1F8BL48_9BACT|nr:MAG: hypothetical protein A2124_04620 [Candidatus Woesebacteria bacterium GWB1_37_5]OGM25231.1 MAG: hypothetical protein A2715_04255 [Candidatus Woesebacteria bacterium RIFCSPHIGHO2_01_FULL_39_32]OGM37731.1 MAG: hypothetical protein A3F01_01465 [Candidatus Woesebacteria bacterium RIFCSPHIGHO2_12_FULL_38_11]OGM64763.1 MAG: hypothetical protein A2893_03865 [Candidatus Woesebacteria bacterium RIFCSPLOWO2_01_FULL_39_25]